MLIYLYWTSIISLELVPGCSQLWGRGCGHFFTCNFQNGDIGWAQRSMLRTCCAEADTECCRASMTWFLWGLWDAVLILLLGPLPPLLQMIQSSFSVSSSSTDLCILFHVWIGVFCLRSMSLPHACCSSLINCWSFYWFAN